ncbi:MAG TPA: FAD-dependent oxidoreductase, partial [Dehalococcoidia bacterium]|nr:FAD-dependent oxidoreductase [Dehalococcoidia bacterium]
MAEPSQLAELTAWKANHPAPCQVACPIHTDARGYVLLSSVGRFEEAFQVASDGNPLVATCGRACSAPCETACTRGEIDKPIAIRRIKRFLADRHAERRRDVQVEVHPPTGRRIAIVGSGPAGLAAAHDLAVSGHSVTIFEAATRPGGMAILGVPRFRLPGEVMEQDVEAVRRLGVEIRTETRVGQDVGLEELRAAFDAIFVAAGACEANRPPIPGADLERIHLALPWIEEANLGGRPPCGDSVIIIGGGYTAMDVSRTAVRLGASRVAIYYRRTRKEMEVPDEELAETLEEGVGLYFLAAPLRFLSEDGQRVSAVEFIRNELGDLDASGRRRPVPIPGSEFIVEADAVILAIGQKPDISFLGGGLSTNVEDGLLKVDSETLMTGFPGVFAGGDYITGPGTIVEAVAHGRRAAAAIHRYLGFAPPSNGHLGTDVTGLPMARLYEGPQYPRRQPPMPKLDMEARRSELAIEVEEGFDEEMVVTDALRCLYCGLQPQIIVNECILCDACVEVCPPRCIHTISGVSVGADGVPRPGWTESFEAIISYRIDEEACIQCGRCL